VSPAATHADESLNTLRYAERARSITNSVNPNSSKSDALLPLTSSQIATLQEENKILRARITNLSRHHATNDLTVFGSGRGGIDVTSLATKLQLARQEANATRQNCREVSSTSDRIRERFNIFPSKNDQSQRTRTENVHNQELEALCQSLRQEIDFVNSENDILRHQNIRLQDEIQRLRSSNGASDIRIDTEKAVEEEDSDSDRIDTMSSDQKKIRTHAERLLSWADRVIEKSRNDEVDDTCGSTNTSVGTDLRPSYKKETCAIFRARNSAEDRENQFYIGNLNTVENACTCPCQDSVFSKQPAVVDFYLPKLGIVCPCGRKDDVQIVGTDPCCLENILRDWQIEFLRSSDIYTAADLLHAYTKDLDALAKAMRIWRKEKGMLSVKTSSCAIALRIWARTCKVVLNPVHDKKTSGKATRPDFLDVSLSSDTHSVSTLGFCASVTE
jgi:hypothetical protein